MHKLMIVDDEKIVIDSVSYIIKKNFKNVKVIGAARSGEEAIELFVSQKPDIVLMDICMAGMNGLEAIAELRQISKAAKFVIISAYEQFEFAKQAVELDVSEYLLKPFNSNRLVDTISKIVDEIEEEKTRLRKSIENKGRYEQALKILEQWLVYSILLHKDPSEELRKYRDLTGIEEHSGFIMIFDYDVQENSDDRLASKKAPEDQKLLAVVNDLLKSRTNCLIGLSTNNSIICYVFFAKQNEAEDSSRCIGLAQDILKEMKKISSLNIVVGIGGIKENSLILSSYEEAKEALRKSRGEIRLFSDMISVEEKKASSLSNLDLLTAIDIGDVEHVSFALQEIDNYNRNALIELVVMAHRIALEQIALADSSEGFNNYLSEALDIEERQELADWVKSRLLDLTTKVHRSRDLNSSKIIQETKEYLLNNYNKEISLESTAKEFNLSPHYLSKLFKKETKENFIEYLTRLRIAKAKELLKEGEKSIKEICFFVGYTDPNYFSRIFKKYTDYSPSEFIKGV